MNRRASIQRRFFSLPQLHLLALWILSMEVGQNVTSLSPLVICQSRGHKIRPLLFTTNTLMIAVACRGCPLTGE
jgi:hypothetical protein